MIRAIIIEDQPPAQRILQKYAEDLGTISILATFSDAISAMQFLDKNEVDLLFLDVHLPKMSGIDFLRTSTSTLPPVILTTAFADYALEGYEYNVIDYLLKPFSFARFVQAISKISPATNETPQMEQSLASSPTSFLIKSGYDFVKVERSEILYIQADSDYTILYTKGKKLLTNHTLKYWREKLVNDQFCQIHKSTIVNLLHLDKISGNRAFINNVPLSIGRSYRDDFLARWNT